MPWEAAMGLMMGSLVLLLALGLPVVFAFMTVDLIGAVIFLGGDAGLFQLVRNMIQSVSKFELIPIPLFILMGEIMFRTGLAERAIDAVDRIIVRVPGRLSVVTVVGGTLFASLSGSTMANTAILGSTLFPEMRRLGYHPSMAMGPILGTGGIAMLIPPSGLAVLLGSLARIPISELLIAGIVPGMIIAMLFFTYIVIRCVLDPSLAPPHAAEDLAAWDRIRPFLVYVLPLLAIFVVVVGSILFGIATPTESAALGSVAALAAAAAYRSLKWESFKAATRETAKITAMIFFIVCFSLTFSQILAFSGATRGLLAAALGLHLAPASLIAVMMVVLLFLGMFLDSLGMMMITLPFFIPLVKTFHFDLVWFGILMLLALEISFTTPPFGMLLFVMKGVAPADITMRHIWKAAIPFILLEILTLAVIFIFPSSVTWLLDWMRTR